ncbi:MAG: HAD family hydrolase [Chthoniobacterales bacterium]
MIRNLIFDWSGTLADDLRPVWKATNAIFREYGAKDLSLEDFRKHFRLPFAGFYEELLPQADAGELEILYEKFFQKLHWEVTLLPGAREILELCKRTGRRAFLLSTIRPEHFEIQAEHLGVRDCFEHPYVGVPDKREKILRVIEERGFDPGETVFVGDMVHDIETAHFAGIASAAVLTGFDTAEKLLPAKPVMIFENLTFLHRLLEVG